MVRCRAGSNRALTWFFAPRTPMPLAAIRIAVGCYALAWLAFTTPELRDLGTLDGARFDPVGVVAITGVGPASTATITIWIAVCAAAGVAFSAGWRFRLFGPLFAITMCWLTTYQNCWSKLLHTENLLVLHLLVLACSPAADALATRRCPPPVQPTHRAAYGWPLCTMALATVLTYLCAGVTKLRHAGWSWFDPDNLRNWIAYDLVRKELFGDPYLPIAIPTLEHSWLLIPAIVGTLAIELGAPLALVRQRAAVIWVAAAWLFHIAVLASMSVVFPYQLTGVAYLPVLLASHPNASGHQMARHESSRRDGEMSRMR